jgi:hypothetical protein
MIHSVKRQKVFKLFIRDEHSWASLNQNLTHLTLIGPSEVKFDLYDFNPKLYENLSTLLEKYLFLQKLLSNLVEFMI